MRHVAQKNAQLKNIQKPLPFTRTNDITEQNIPQQFVYSNPVVRKATTINLSQQVDQTCEN